MRCALAISRNQSARRTLNTLAQPARTSNPHHNHLTQTRRPPRDRLLDCNTKKDQNPVDSPQTSENRVAYLECFPYQSLLSSLFPLFCSVSAVFQVKSSVFRVFTRCFQVILLAFRYTGPVFLVKSVHLRRPASDFRCFLHTCYLIAGHMPTSSADLRARIRLSLSTIPTIGLKNQHYS